MMDWLATQKLVQLDGRTDPRVGMVGGSYGGGIQLVTAAIDCRIDAIVPTIAWHSLATSLNKAATVKIGWSNLLYTTAASRNLDPHITSAYNAAARDRRDIAGRPRVVHLTRAGPAHQPDHRADALHPRHGRHTLHPRRSRHELRDAAPARGATAMLWYCGGHGVCLTDAGDSNRSQVATAAWLKRWLQRDTTVDTGSACEHHRPARHHVLGCRPSARHRYPAHRRWRRNPVTDGRRWLRTGDRHQIGQRTDRHDRARYHARESDELGQREGHRDRGGARARAHRS